MYNHFFETFFEMPIEEKFQLYSNENPLPNAMLEIYTVNHNNNYYFFIIFFKLKNSLSTLKKNLIKLLGTKY